MQESLIGWGCDTGCQNVSRQDRRFRVKPHNLTKPSSGPVRCSYHRRDDRRDNPRNRGCTLSAKAVLPSDADRNVVDDKTIIFFILFIIQLGSGTRRIRSNHFYGKQAGFVGTYNRSIKQEHPPHRAKCTAAKLQ